MLFIAQHTYPWLALIRGIFSTPCEGFFSVVSDAIIEFCVSGLPYATLAMGIGCVHEINHDRLLFVCYVVSARCSIEPNLLNQPFIWFYFYTFYGRWLPFCMCECVCVCV